MLGEHGAIGGHEPSDRLGTPSAVAIKQRYAMRQSEATIRMKMLRCNCRCANSATACIQTFLQIPRTSVQPFHWSWLLNEAKAHACIAERFSMLANSALIVVRIKLRVTVYVPSSGCHRRCVKNTRLICVDEIGWRITGT